MFHQEVQGALAGLKAHQPGLAVELALGRKAVAAVQVAGVGHVQAQGLDHIGTVLEVEGVAGVSVGGEQLALLRQFVDVVQAVRDVGGGHIVPARVLLGQGRGGLRAGAAAVDRGDGVVGDVLHGVHAAAEHVQHDVVAAQFILMDHGKLLAK